MIYDIEWRITNRPNMQTFIVSFKAEEDENLKDIKDWFLANRIEVMQLDLAPAQTVAIGSLLIDRGPTGNIRFMTEEGASLFKLAWC